MKPLTTTELIEAERFGFNLQLFRTTALALVKYAMRARVQAEPGAIDDSQLDKWKLSNWRKENRSVFVLLTSALTKHESAYRLINSVGDSGGIAHGDPLGDLKCSILEFLRDDYVAQVLPQLRLDPGADVDWNAVAKWDDLESLREEIDRIPDRPSRELVASTDSVSLFEENGRRIALVGGEELRLTKSQFKCLCALADSPSQNLTGAELRRAAGGDAVNTLKNLRNTHPQLESLILLPGRAHLGGYQLC